MQGCAGFSQWKFHENVHSRCQRRGKMRECKEDGIAGGGKVRVGCKPTAAWDQPTADGAAKTTTQGQRLQRGALSQMDSRQAGARAEKKPCEFDEL